MAWARRIDRAGAWAGFLCLVCLLSMTGPGRAEAPFIDPGNRQYRYDIELLKAHRLIDGTVSTWPIAWKQIARSLADIPPEKVRTEGVRRAIARLKAGIETFESQGGIGGALEIGGTNRERLVRDFAGGVRDEFDARVMLDGYLGRLYIRGAVGYRDDPESSDINFDGSVAALPIGNWMIFGGFPDQWFGPGFDSALVLSTNARPIPRIGIQRLDPKRIDFPVLRWLGPVQFNFTTGFDGDDRGDFDDVLVIFSRLSIEPLPGLQIGTSRGLQLCGSGRSCTAGNIAGALVTVVDFVFQVGGDLDNTGDLLTDPGNQVAGLDFRYTFAAGGLSVTGYSEVASEDSSGPVAIGDVSITMGAQVSGFWDRFGGLSWTVRGEASDTQSNRFFGINAPGQPGSANRNFIFTDGYTYQDRFIGPSIGGDGGLFTGEASAIDRAGRLFYLRYRHAVINRTGLMPTPDGLGRIAFANQVSDTPERINFFEAGLEWPGFFGGYLGLDVRLADDAPNTPGRKDFNGAVEARWRLRF